MIFCFCLSLSLLGNIHHIHFDKLPDNLKHNDKIDFLFMYESYFDHWNQKWNYSVSKDSLIKELRICYETFSKIDYNSIEINLLLGDIAHFLYNLDESSFNDKAINYYEAAEKIDSSDYRAYWFLANHYCMSNQIKKSIDTYFKAKKLIPKAEPPEFWEQFAFAAALSNMNSNCIFAMSKVRQITGKPGIFETQMGDAIRERLKDGDPNLSYAKKDLWYGVKGTPNSFISRPLGIMVSLDSTWQINPMDYANNVAAVVFMPPRLKSKSGKEIGITIAILAKVVTSNDDINNLITKMSAQFPQKKKIDFSTKYDKMVSYDLKNKNAYKDRGGARAIIIGFERSCPNNPGLLLERPIALTSDKKQVASYFRFNTSINRFKPSIQYVIMLDTCEDIYPESLQLLKDWFETQLVIE
jgi:tetratricopeptide (TPR) repeat protein